MRRLRWRSSASTTRSRRSSARRPGRPDAMPDAAADKIRRHREIRAVVRDEVIESQESLARILARRGFLIPQATLSRDLKELRILRSPREGGYRYQPSAEGEGEPGNGGAHPEARRMQTVASLEVTGLDSNESCVVVRTLTGRAALV